MVILLCGLSDTEKTCTAKTPFWMMSAGDLGLDARQRSLREIERNKLISIFACWSASTPIQYPRQTLSRCPDTRRDFQQSHQDQCAVQ